MGGDLKPKLLVIGGLLALAVAGVGVVLFAGKGNTESPEEAAKRLPPAQQVASAGAPGTPMTPPPPPPTIAPLADDVTTPVDPFAGGPKAPAVVTQVTTGGKTVIIVEPPKPDQIPIMGLPSTVLTSNYGGIVSGELGVAGPAPTGEVLPLDPGGPGGDVLEVPTAMRGAANPIARRASPGFETYRAQVYAAQGQPFALVSVGSPQTITLGVGSTWGDYRVRSITADLVVFSDAYGRSYYLPATPYIGGRGA